MDENRIEGAATRIGGDIKSGLGDALGDTRLSGEGRYDQARGTAQNTMGGLADMARSVFRSSGSNGASTGSSLGGSTGLRSSAKRAVGVAERNPVLALLAMGAAATFLGNRVFRKR